MKITIDPGINLGWAIWEDDWTLLRHGILVSSGFNKVESVDKTELEIWKKKADEVTLLIKAIGKYCNEGFIEYPSAFGGGVAVQSGAVVKLATLTGMIVGALNYQINLIPVNNWKAQLPKDVVIKRIKKLLPKCKATSHDWDAIGLGLYLKGVL